MGRTQTVELTVYAAVKLKSTHVIFLRKNVAPRQIVLFLLRKHAKALPPIY